MKLKASSSKFCVLLAILFFINPVIVTADVLFSATYSNSVSLVSTEPSDSKTCHDDMNADPATKQVMDHSNMDSDMDSDCCVDVCHCDDSGCHASSLVFQFKSQLSFISQQDHFYHLPIYLSLAFTPSSPPPIV
jgi:hypothetical protein